MVLKKRRIKKCNHHCIVFLLCCLRYSFALLKCLQPKKPFEAEYGDGCGAVRMR